MDNPSQNSHVLNFIETRLAVLELFHTHGRTDGLNHLNMLSTGFLNSTEKINVFWDYVINTYPFLLCKTNILYIIHMLSDICG
jgi:hypothetical protein